MNRRSVSTLLLFSGLLTALTIISGCRPNSGKVVVNGRVISGSGNGVFLGSANGSNTRGTQQAAAEFRQTLSVGGIQMLDVRGENGNISVAAAQDASRIVVHAVRQVQGNRTLAQLQTLLPELKVTATVEGAKLVLKSEYPRAWHNQDISANVSYEVEVPARLVVDVTNVNGSVSVQGTQNGLDVTTQNGNVQLNNIAGLIHAAATNGSISVENASRCAEVRLRTESGNVTASHVQAIGTPPNVDIATENGSVTYAGAAAALKLATTSGNVNATLNGSPDNAHVSSVNGSLDLRLPPDASAHLTADTTNGTVDVPHATTNKERTSARATLGSGRVPIVLNTTSGNIRVEVP